MNMQSGDLIVSDDPDPGSGQYQHERIRAQRNLKLFAHFISVATGGHNIEWHKGMRACTTNKFVGKFNLFWLLLSHSSQLG
jgi:hypothetical protein